MTAYRENTVFSHVNRQVVLQFLFFFYLGDEQIFHYDYKILTFFVLLTQFFSFFFSILCPFQPITVTALLCGSHMYKTFYLICIRLQLNQRRALLSPWLLRPTTLSIPFLKMFLFNEPVDKINISSTALEKHLSVRNSSRLCYFCCFY